jgi:hypothetical protein
VTEGVRPDTFLRLMAERASADPAYLGWVVQMYAASEGRNTADVLAQLGMSDDSATGFWLSLKPVGERFAEMLKAICIRFDAQEHTLLALLREVEVLDGFREGNGGATGADSASAYAGLLMAARMREQGHPRRRVVEKTETDRGDDHSDAEDSDAR